VRRIVERHGGEVGLSRQEGGGTRARIVLACAPGGRRGQTGQ